MVNSTAISVYLRKFDFEMTDDNSRTESLQLTVLKSANESVGKC